MQYPKINIFFPFTAQGGGGNQFLIILRNKLQEIQVYENEPEKADIILINSHHAAKQVIHFFSKYPHKTYIHRIDGPMSLYNIKSDQRDTIVHFLNTHIADASIFQSRWCQKECTIRNVTNNNPATVIHNAPRRILSHTITPGNQHNHSLSQASRRIRLISANWSTNMNKGFQTMRWLDENLDFSKYEYNYFGNSPIQFNNIKQHPAIENTCLLKMVSSHDIFIFTSIFEACSNMLLEALGCKVPCLVSNTSSNPEIIGNGGLSYNNPIEIPSLLQKICLNYSHYQANIQVPEIEETANKYLTFAHNIWSKKTAFPKKTISATRLLMLYYFLKLKSLIRLK
jgi:hypothetical protein